MSSTSGVYLDNAATTYPKPQAVYDAVDRFMRTRAANPGRSGHRMSMQAAEEVYACRSALAALFHADGPECVAFTQNATQAVNMALKGRLTRGGHVVTSNLEHNAVMRPLEKLAERGVSYSVAAVDLEDDGRTLENFRRQIRPDTVMVACTHGSNVCGRVLPAEKIGRLCAERGIEFLLDASQSAGVLPIDMQACHITYLCVPGHKSLYGPMGTGALITGSGEKLETILEGGTGSNSVSLEQPDFMPDRLESGTVNAPGIAGLHAGAAFVVRRTPERIYREEQALCLALYDALARVEGVRLYTPRPEHGYLPVLGFNIGGMSSVEATSELDRMGFALRGGLHCSPAAHYSFGTISQGMIRASFGAFNTRDDAVRLADAVRKIASSAPAGASAGESNDGTDASPAAKKR